GGVFIAACEGDQHIKGKGGDGGAGAGSTMSGDAPICDLAAAHAQDCLGGAPPAPGVGGGGGFGGGGQPPPCTGALACEALCVISAPCEAVLGHQGPAFKAFADCLQACVGQTTGVGGSGGSGGAGGSGGGI